MWFYGNYINYIKSNVNDLYTLTRTNWCTQRHWPNMEDRRSFRFLSHLLLFDWIQIFNGFHKFPISRCVCLYVLECVSYVMRMQKKRDDIAYAIRRWWENKEKKKTSLCIHSATEIESKILLITCLHFFPVEHAINSKQDRHGKAKAINYIRMLMVPLTRIFAD